MWCLMYTLTSLYKLGYILLKDFLLIISTNCDPLCEIQAKFSKSNYEITSIKI